MTLILSSISQGILWSILAIGVYLTFRILDLADLTVEGSYPMGAGIAAALIVAGVNPFLATLVAVIGGMLTGLVTGLLHTKLKIPALLAGIVTMTGLYSINLKIMGSANVTLLGEDTVYSIFSQWGLSSGMSLMLAAIIAIIIVVIILDFIFKSEVGLAIIATGDNLKMSEANGINVHTTKIIGYMLGNGLIALAGALLAQNNGFADVNMGIGTIVIGLASIIIGEAFFGSLTFTKRLIAIVVGSIIYRLLILIVLEMNVNPQDIKLFSAIILAVALGAPAVREKLKPKKRKGVN